MRTASIYIIRNTINDKVYIGQTTMTVRERFTCHMKPSNTKKKTSYKIYNAINKYGSDKFYVETLENNIDLSKINDVEISYIDKFDSYYNGYNSTKGGDGRIISVIEDEDRVLNMAKGGMNSLSIAKELNVHKGTVLRTLNRLGFKYYNNITKESIDKLLSKGNNNSQIANILGVDKATVTRFLTNNNMGRYNIRISSRESFDLQGLIDDYNDQMPIPELCIKYNITKTSLHRLRVNNNIKTRKKLANNKVS